MIAQLLCAAAFLQSAADGSVRWPRITVLLTDSWESHLLHAELTRDWTKTAEGRNPKLAVFNHIRDALHVKIKVNRGMLGLPKYKWGSGQQWYDYDRRAFRCSTWPLLYTAWLVSHRWWSNARYSFRLTFDAVQQWRDNVYFTLSEECLDDPIWYDPADEDDELNRVDHMREPIWAEPVEPLPPWHPTARRALMNGYNP